MSIAGTVTYGNYFTVRSEGPYRIVLSAVGVAFIVFFGWYMAGDFPRAQLYASVGTMPFGLTEPLFVPKYWSPPSLFALARRTGFDIESLIFCFAIGGIGVVLNNALTGRGFERISLEYRHLALHRYHGLAVAVLCGRGRNGCGRSRQRSLPAGAQAQDLDWRRSIPRAHARLRGDLDETL